MKVIDLNGTWQLRWNDGQRGDKIGRVAAKHADLTRAWDAAVPGEVHDTLIRAGVIAEPNVGRNALAARWVEEMFWNYRRTFTAPRLAKGERAWLVFEALDLAAVIYLNGKEAGRHANAFHPCRLEVTDRLVAGENVLAVEVESGLFHAAHRSAEGYNVGADSQLTKRPWLRKTQSEHAWDWSPRLLNVGITGPVRLEIARTARAEQFAILSDLSDDLTAGKVTGRAIVEGLGRTPCKGVMTVSVKETRQSVRVPVVVKPGMNRLEAALTVARPALWWPVGHGPQKRYTVTVALTVGGEAAGSVTRKTGFRRVRINQDPHPDKGRYFIIEVNGKPIFCKGGNFVPADLIPSRMTPERYAALIDRAVAANANFLRIWGGGLYESDDFYEACDERGILVWQEFIFACAKYPATDEAFLADVKREAVYQIRRLAHRPSLIVWCGNNEMEWGGWAWGYEKGVAHPDYALFHLVLPRLLNEEDGTRYYQPSSPFSPDHANPNADELGDQHPWSIGMGDADFRKYRQMFCRFPNEGGILGPTALPTMRASLEGGPEAIGSFAWELHDNSVCYWDWVPAYAPDRMLDQWLGRSVRGMRVEDFVYWGGLVQGLGLAEYVNNFRRRMFDSASAVFWMFNDVWPCTRSWTIVDHALRRTPAFWPVRRAFAPVTVVVTRQDDRVRIYGVNDGDAWTGVLRFGLMALAGRYPLDKSQEVTLRANASTLLAEFDAKPWDKLGVSTHVAFALLSAGSVEAARHCLMLPLFKDMRWPKAHVRVRWADGKAVFTSKTFAWRVCLDLDGERDLPDNFFDVYPGIPTVRPWPRRLGPPRVLRLGNG